MTPEQARERFSAALEGELEPDERDAFERALAEHSELARDYAAFADMLARARGAPPPSPPDLLPGVQRRLRQRSRGRFYRDRFSERLGRGATGPLLLALVMLALLALAWLGLAALEQVRLPGPS